MGCVNANETGVLLLSTCCLWLDNVTIYQREFGQWGKKEHFEQINSMWLANML